MSDPLIRGLIVGGLAASAAGVWWLMALRWHRAQVLGLVAAVAGLILSASALGGAGGDVTDRILFWLFASTAILCGVLMVTSRNPVYAALWFALTTLGVCGLFLLLSAPFLAAATIIVYAGAIIVTFLFVIMMAQQSGATIYDQRSRAPGAAVAVSFLLLGALLMAFQRWEHAQTTEPPSGPALVAAEQANPLSQPQPGESLVDLHALGRSLFGDYLFSVEIAGTLLLVAGIGAIAIAPRRSHGAL